MTELELIDLQESVERSYNKRHVDGYIRAAIASNPVVVAKINQGVELINTWMSKTYYASKDRRIDQLRSLDMEQIVTEIFVGIAYCLDETLFTSVTAQLASRLRFDNKRDAITTVAEMVAVLCMTDAFDICKANRGASLVVVSLIPLDAKVLEFIENTRYLPPMLCTPRELTTNYSSGYLTHNDSLILGSGNHHDGDICLDVLNTLNRVELQLATDFLSTVEEEPTFELDTQDKVDQWMAFKKQSYKFYLLIAKAGNRFWLTHKADKRGRLYASGYNISTMGSAFKKASIELAKEELVTGVPN